MTFHSDTSSAQTGEPTAIVLSVDDLNKSFGPLEMLKSVSPEASKGNVIAMFLTSVETTTLPKKMLDGIFFDLSPIFAAISAVWILFNTLLAVLELSLEGVSKKSNA